MNEHPQHSRNQVEYLLSDLLARMERMERRIDDVAEDVDTIDRTLRPYGDGTKTRGRRR